MGRLPAGPRGDWRRGDRGGSRQPFFTEGLQPVWHSSFPGHHLLTRLFGIGALGYDGLERACESFFGFPLCGQKAARELAGGGGAIAGVAAGEALWPWRFYPAYYVFFLVLL